MRVKPAEIIRTFKKLGSTKLTAESLGIHRTTVYRWVKRAKGLSSTNVPLKTHVTRKSTRPKTIHFALSEDERNKVVALRRVRQVTAEKLVKKLSLPVHPSTVHRLLLKHGLVRKYGYHRRPRFQNTLHMHLGNTKTIGYLQFDVKYITPQLSGLPYTCFEYAVIDIFSRYKEAVILNHLDQDGSMAAILEILPKLPFKPVFIQTDNGLEFQGRFHKMCTDMGLKHHLIHKQTPNENALIERSFRTDEEEFFFWLEKAPENYDELRNLFADWLHEYNFERPHLGINLKTPYEIVANVLLD
jgi:transposase InsO family protein